MSTTFAQLAIGERFHYNVDADGHEPYLYKLSDTHAYVEGGSGTGTRQPVMPTSIVHAWSAPAQLSSAVTEIERAALTLLTHNGEAEARHIALRLWIDAMLQDTDEVRSLDTFVRESDDVETSDGTFSLREILAKRGLIAPDEKRTLHITHKNSTFLAIANERPHGRKSETHEEHSNAMDHSRLWLAYAIRSYRLAGRPTGDYTSGNIRGLGSTLATVQTSLAAAVVEFHRRVTNETYHWATND